MPISAGLREDIAVYRGFIGQQYFIILFLRTQMCFLLSIVAKETIKSMHLV